MTLDPDWEAEHYPPDEVADAGPFDTLPDFEPWVDEDGEPMELDA